MPVEIKELVIKATVALDWENKTITDTGDDIVCLRLPSEKKIALYVHEFFSQHKAETLTFDESKLSAFLVEWQAFLLK
jgi:hypothetical protein